MKRTDVDKVLIIGSGPIVIGQACEFDYSGTQACKALRACGYKVVLVNSNPATIMTDPVMADATYIEPLNEARLEQIIEKERPDAILPNLGGQTGLNLSMELAKKGILDKYGVKVIGVNLDAIERGEDREVFKATMQKLGIETPRSGIVHSVEAAVELVEKEIGYPVVVRPAYTMGGAGGGFCYNVEELRTICARGLDASLTHQCLIEESILNWEELEVEVVRDAKNQMIAVCFIENIDAVGVHTGDSYCAAPFLTIDKKLEERLRRDAFKIVESIGVIGGTNVQFAHDPKTGRVVIIEINPRTSRSSALASKATGFPIALVSAKLAAGMTMDERQDLQGDFPEGDSRARARSRRPRLCEGLPREVARRAPEASRRSQLRAPLPDVRGDQERRDRRADFRAYRRQGVLRRPDARARRGRGEDPRLQGQGASRRPARAGEEGRLFRQVPRADPRRSREGHPRAAQQDRLPRALVRRAGFGR